MTYHVPAVLAAPPVALPPPSHVAAKILAVADALQPVLAAGQPIDTGLLRAEMERAFGGSDATGAWDWKLAVPSRMITFPLGDLPFSWGNPPRI